MRGIRWLLLLSLLGGCAAAPRPTPAAPPVAEREHPPLPDIFAPGGAPGGAAAPQEPDVVIAVRPPEPCDWPLWRAYQARFISPDGRVIDRTDDDKSTSEGQSYALFFALVAGDRPLFDRLLLWTEENLAGGDLRERLPAWKWGRGEDGTWGVLDPNPASDSDLWIAWVLHEAARIWNEPSYRLLGERMLAMIEKREVKNLPGLGKMLLPAPAGFEHEKGRSWRLNPSYLPPQLLRRFANRGPWAEVLENTTRMMRESSPHGLVADWILWHRDHGFGVDPVKGAIGSYDAIRVYLWASFLDPDDPLRPVWMAATEGLWRQWQHLGEVPETVDVVSARAARRGPPGFTAVLLSEAVTRGNDAAAARLEEALARTWNGSLYGDPPTYYDQNLILFARGHVEGRFSFARDGTLRTRGDGGGCGE